MCYPEVKTINDVVQAWFWGLGLGFIMGIGTVIFFFYMLILFR